MTKNLLEGLGILDKQVADVGDVEGFEAGVFAVQDHLFESVFTDKTKKRDAGRVRAGVPLLLRQSNLTAQTLANGRPE